MFRPKADVADPEAIARLWGPRPLRFFYFLGADQAVAESLSIDTLAEASRSHRGPGKAVMLCLAVAKAAVLPQNLMAADDPVVAAVASLPRSQGCVVALFRGIGLGIDELAGALGLSESQACRLLAESLLALHKSLFPKPEIKLERSRVE